MTQKISDITILQEYISGVMERAEHHAGNVNEIALALAGAIIWKKDGEPIEVFTREGKMTNVLWVKFNGNKYAFSYNHGNETIEIRKGTTQGAVLHGFSNDTTITEVIRAFESL